MVLNTRAFVAGLLVGSLFVVASVEANESPHWRKSACKTCHSQVTPVKGNAALNAADAEALCETCHGSRGEATPCRHASDIPVGNMTVDDALAPSTKDDQVVCTTCHDIVYQCEHPKRSFSYENRGFLRDRTSRRAADYCLKCHDGSRYEKLDPHGGVAGSPLRPTCMLCHESIPSSESTDALNVAFNMQHDLNDTCLGCHNVVPHPVGLYSEPGGDDWVHLVSPSEDVLKSMRNFEVATGVTLPRSPVDGEIFCGTCHNQHGFQSSESGPNQPVHRLRSADICQACHDK